MEKKILSQYALFSLRDQFWNLRYEDRKKALTGWCEDAQTLADRVWFYQIFPARADYDVMLWSTSVAEELNAPALFFEKFARTMNNYRPLIVTDSTYWGMTKPSIYAKGQSRQEIDPFANERAPYLVIYPFTKTTDWYLLSKETRQEMMTGHIRIGKQYPQITQLLLYSAGLQDQEFIVSYETEDLSMFSDLVNTLRGVEVRKYTLNDTPIVTGFHRSPGEIVSLFCGRDK